MKQKPQRLDFTRIYFKSQLIKMYQMRDRTKEARLNRLEQKSN